MTLRDDLIAARALIDTPEKWGKGIVNGRFCARYAVREVVFPRDALSDRALVKAIPKSFKGPLGVNAIVAFNDDPSTTHADVLALFDRAIANAGDQL